MQIIMRCVCCQLEDFTVQYSLRDLAFGAEGVWDFVCCSNCGHGCLSPIPSEEELVILYTNLYSKEKKEQMIKMGQGGFDQSLQHRRARMLKQAIGDQQVQCIVDIGCGMGFSLEKLYNLWSDARCVGLEMSPIAAEEAQKISGLEIHHESFQNASQKGLWNHGSIDIVTMNHVVEHLIDPKLDLQMVFEQLKEGGLLLIEVPHLDGWGRNWMKKWWWGHLPPQHIHLFTLTGMKRLLEQIGFQIISEERHGYPLIFLFTWALFLRGTIGGLSSFRTNRFIKIISILIGVVLSPLVITLDIVVTTIMNIKHGDLITIVAQKK